MNEQDKTKVKEVEARLDGVTLSPYCGQRIRINQSAPYFRGEKAIIAYIGNNGVSVYLTDSSFDECICINWGEYDVL